MGSRKTWLLDVPGKACWRKRLFICAVWALWLFISSLAHLSGLQRRLVDMISCHSNAHQESFKLISSRPTCLLQCFNEYSSSCFSPHHLSASRGQTELELSKEEKFHCAVYTYTGELLDEYFPFLFSKACQQKYLNATQTKDKLSSGTKKLVEKRMNRKYVQCRNGGKVFFVKEQNLISVKANIIFLTGFGVVFFW